MKGHRVTGLVLSDSKRAYNFIDITGKKFGRWLVIEMDLSCDKNRVHWICRCDCGTKKSVSAKELRTGRTKSCGCLNREQTAARNTKHGFAGIGKQHPLYGL